MFSPLYFFFFFFFNDTATTEIYTLSLHDALPILAVAVADVQNGGGAAAAQVVERVQMGRGEVFHMDVIADSGAVRRGIVGTEDRDVRPLADRGLAGDFHEQRGIGGGLPHPPRRIRPG